MAKKTEAADDVPGIYAKSKSIPLKIGSPAAKKALEDWCNRPPWGEWLKTVGPFLDEKSESDDPDIARDAQVARDRWRFCIETIQSDPAAVKAIRNAMELGGLCERIQIRPFEKAVRSRKVQDRVLKAKNDVKKEKAKSGQLKTEALAAIEQAKLDNPQRASNIDFISFQDIITSVTGVMILLTLLLSIELIQRVVSSAPQQTKVQITASTQSIEEMKAEVADLQSKLQSSGELPENLPSLDYAALKHKRLQLQETNDRLRGETAKLSDRLNDKRQEVAAAETASASDQQQMAEELARLEKSIDDATKQFQSINASNRIFFRKEQGGKETWIVEVTASGIQAAKIGVAAKPQQFAGIESFARWLKSLDSASTAFYLIVKPDGEVSFEEVKQSVRSAGFDVGFHVLPADQQVIDPNTGAAAP